MHHHSISFFLFIHTYTNIRIYGSAGFETTTNPNRRQISIITIAITHLIYIRRWRLQKPLGTCSMCDVPEFLSIGILFTTKEE